MAERQFYLALVTGASSGIGEALSHLLADKKINLILHGRDEVRLNKLAELLSQKVEVEVVTADLAIPSEVFKVIDKIKACGPDLVINNAGFGLYGEALSHSTTAQMQILEVNGNAVLELTLEAARSLIDLNKKGIILNVSSAAAFQVFPNLAVYAATKNFINQVSEALDFELKEKGVRVLVSCPGVVETGFRHRAGGERREDSSSMSASFAAKEIWWQIQKEKPVHTFNWKYHLGNMISKLIPKQWMFSLLRANINKISRHNIE